MTTREKVTLAAFGYRRMADGWSEERHLFGFSVTLPRGECDLAGIVVDRLLELNPPAPWGTIYPGKMEVTRVEITSSKYRTLTPEIDARIKASALTPRSTRTKETADDHHA